MPRTTATSVVGAFTTAEHSYVHTSGGSRVSNPSPLGSPPVNVGLRHDG